jgi:hypothetical protein
LTSSHELNAHEVGQVHGVRQLGVPSLRVNKSETYPSVHNLISGNVSTPGSTTATKLKLAITQEVFEARVKRAAHIDCPIHSQSDSLLRLPNTIYCSLS